MKKRSLFAAVAMLIVSAIVLTSSTYAWFLASSTVEVDTITASVSASDGSLLLKANHNAASATPTWKATLDDTDFTVSDTLNPVSILASGGALDSSSPLKLSYDGSNFTEDTYTENSDLVHFSFDVQLGVSSSTTGKTVVMTPDFTRGASFVYAIVNIDNTTYVYAGGSDTYKPVLSVTGTVIDDGATTGHAFNAIVDADDTGTKTLGSDMTGAAASGITLWNAQTATTDGTRENFQKTVDVWIWAEGNDSNCRGALSSTDASISFDFQLS